MKNLRITTVQSILHWENIFTNLEMFDEKLRSLSGKTDLVVLPEMFTTGFSMNAKTLAEEMEGQTFQWMQLKAQELGAVIAGSFIVESNGHYYNRLVWMYPNGEYQYYDKRHLFTLAKEHETYTAGIKKMLVEWKGWKICPMVCYDLRFPVWSRNAEGYDLLIYVANWPKTRSYHWKQLLVARAIENQSFVIGVNRVGTDEKGLMYSGDTSVVDYAGIVLHQVSHAENVYSFELSREKMIEYRNKFNFLNDQDKFEILIT